MGEIHELFVLTLSLVWFAGATPDFKNTSVSKWVFGPLLSNGRQLVGAF